MKLFGISLTQAFPPNLNSSTLVPEKQNTKVTKENKNKNKQKQTKQEIKRICCGVPPMSAEFNVFSQTVWLLTVVPHMVLVRTSIKRMVCSSETK
jgi:hypothetical protein